MLSDKTYCFCKTMLLRNKTMVDSWQTVWFATKQVCSWQINVASWQINVDSWQINVASWQFNIASRPNNVDPRQKPMLLCDKSCCFATKTIIGFATNQCASWQNKLVCLQARLLCDKADYWQTFSFVAGAPRKASPLCNWLIHELQPARFVSLLQEARLREIDRYDIKRICAIMKSSRAISYFQ